MICYRDRTWCPFLDCLNIGCNRRLTFEVRAEAAEAWIKNNIPLAEYTSKPECYEEVLK